jgi:hypothetical protein
MAKKEITSKVTDMSIEFMDNGYNIRYSGRDADDDWVEARLVMTDINAVIDHLRMIDETLTHDV